MHSYSVSFTYEGSRYTQMIQASTSEAARRLIVGQYPGCTIWDITKL
jgi:hypothetical protein